MLKLLNLSHMYTFCEENYFSLVVYVLFFLSPKMKCFNGAKQ